jgi:hypothetical protein
MKGIISLPGKLLVTWVISGAVLCGGGLVVYGLFAEEINHWMLLETVGVLYLVGGALGFLLAGALGMLGRPSGMAAKEAFHDQLTGALYVLPLGTVGFIAAGWIALSYWSVYSGNFGGLLLATVSWLGLAVVAAFAVEYGWLGFRNVGERLSRIRHVHVHVSIEEHHPGPRDEGQGPGPTGQS